MVETIMLPDITISTNTQYNMKCDMCSRNIEKKKHYTYKSPLSDTTLEICTDCALREHYGTKRKNTKRYKKDLANDKLFHRKPIIKNNNKQNAGTVIKRDEEEANEKVDVWWDKW